MTCVIVLGCYRTGSSAVAGVLHHLGVMMGHEFDPPAKSNPKGYFEDLEFKRFHHQMDEMKGRWEGEPAECYQRLVKQREQQFPLWGIKDPKLCLYLPVLLESLQGNHKLINVNRSVEDIASSLERAMGGSMTPLVEFYLKAKELNLSKYKGPVMNVEFEQLSTSIPDIAEFVGLPMTKEARGFVE